jgi:hypothetical protein
MTLAGTRLRFLLLLGLPFTFPPYLAIPAKEEPP